MTCLSVIAVIICLRLIMAGVLLLMRGEWAGILLAAAGFIGLMYIVTENRKADARDNAIEKS